LQITGRKMKSLSFIYKDKKILTSQNAKNPASWNLENASKRKNGKGLLHVKDEKLPEIHIIKIGQSNGYAQIPGFLGLFTQELPQYGFRDSIPIKNIIAVSGDKANDMKETRRKMAYDLDQAYAQIVQSTATHPSLIFIFLPDKGAELYANVKWWSDCIKGIPTMCISADAIKQAVLGTSKHPGNDLTVLANLW